MLNLVICAAVFFAPSLPFLSGITDLQSRIETSSLLALDRELDRERSLHPEHDPLSPSYSGRRSPGPVHGKDPHGDDPNGEDPHDEVHDKGLPANKEQAKYYPHSLLNKDRKPVDPKLEKDDPPDNNDLKKQAPINSDKKRVSDLIPTEPKPL